MNTRPTSRDGFSLVEVVIAIGIFAFVIVGIIGLFPAALRIRSESALDTRAAMIAQQLMASIDSASSVTNNNLLFPSGFFDSTKKPYTTNVIITNDLIKPVVLGFQGRSTLPFWYYATNPVGTWSNSNTMDPELVGSMAENQIDTLARVSATTNNLTNLVQITIDVRSPAAMPATNSRVVTFTTYRPYP